MNAEQKIDIVAVLADQSVPYWVKSSINNLLEKDPVDAYKCSDLVARIFKQRCDEILEKMKAESKNPKGWEFAQ